MTNESGRPQAYAAFLAEVDQRIEQFGWIIQSVVPPEDNELQIHYSYTVGLSAPRFRHAELIICGLGPEMARSILNGLADAVKAGHTFVSGEMSSGHLKSGLDLQVISAPLAHGRCPLEVANSLFGSVEPVPALQVVWPDANNRFPWQLAFDPGYIEYQPLLGPPPSDIA